MIWSLLICLSGVYGFIALVLKIYPRIIFEGLFLNRLCPPQRYLKLDMPEKVYGLVGAKSIRLESLSGNTIGVWHIPPPDCPDQSLSDARKVILYCHGNAFHRGFDHRLQLYKRLIRQGFHVITFDYSGFADSAGRPTIPNLVKDAVSVFKWAISQVEQHDCTIVVWGHSLGTHISTKALLTYCSEEHRKPDCLVLEAPFTTAIEASEYFPISKIALTLYPFFKSSMQNTLHSYESTCSTIDILRLIPMPILIMHSEDDQRVDFNLGVKLYEETISDPTAKSRFIRFLHVDKRHQVKHYTARYPQTEAVVQEFLKDMDKCRSSGSKKYEVVKV